MGAIEKYIICPGVMPRDEIVKKIPDSYKKMKPDITIYLRMDHMYLMNSIYQNEREVRIKMNRYPFITDEEFRSSFVLSGGNTK